MAKLGMFLIGAVIWASEQVEGTSRPPNLLRAAAGRMALAGVSIIGTLIDALASSPAIPGPVERSRIAGSTSGRAPVRC